MEQETKTKGKQVKMKPQIQEAQIEDVQFEEAQMDKQMDKQVGISPSKVDVEFIGAFFENRPKQNEEISEIETQIYNQKEVIAEYEKLKNDKIKAKVENDKNFNNIILKYKEIFERENGLEDSKFVGFGENGTLLFE